MRPRRENDKTRSIKKWLEGVSMTTSDNTEESRRITRSKQISRRRPQDQPDILSPTYSSEVQPPTTLTMGRPGLRDRKPKQPHPAEASSEERPPTKKRRKAANTQQNTPGPAPQPRSVRFLEEGESRAGSSYVTSHSHSSNRAQRGKLQSAEPEVIFAALDSQEEKPNEVYEFMRRLVDRLDNAIPASHKHQLATQQTSNNLERDNEATQADLRLWDRVDEIIEQANKSLEQHVDESYWTKLVDPLMESVMGKRDTLFTVHPVQTASIIQSLIPTLPGQPFAFKKIDFAIFLGDSDPEVRELYREIRKRHPELELCQSDNEPICHFCHLAAIETKSPDGSYYGATIQLAIWLAAGLEKMRQLSELAITGVASTVSASTSGDGVGGAAVDKSSDSASPPLPNIGIAVVGHAWYLHLAVKAADGSVVIYGPRLIGDTSDRSGIFRIIASLEAIRSWGEEVYYPWLRSHILMPLAGKTD